MNNGYDTYDSAIVCADNEEEARNTLPSQRIKWHDQYSQWCSSPENVQVQEIGAANPSQKKGVILASFNAG